MARGNSRKRSKKRISRKQSKKHSSRKHYRKTRLSPFNVCEGLKKSVCNDQPMCNWRGSTRKSGISQEKNYRGPFKPSWMFY